MNKQEIKFRVWDKENTKWSSVRNLLLDRFGESTIYGIPPNDYKRFVFQRYTGLKDSKGTEIYEGDILFIKLSSGQTLEGNVIYEPDRGGYIVIWKSNLTPRQQCYVGLNCDTSFESAVIGNIFENPKSSTKL